MSIKDFFWFSLSAMMLGICSLCLFYIWNSKRARKETIASQQAEAIKEKNKEDELQLKRSLLCEYYATELSVLLELRDNPSNTLEQSTYRDKELETTKANMLQDGFDRPEIEALYMKGYRQAKKHWEEQAKKKQNIKQKPAEKKESKTMADLIETLRS